MTGNPQVEVWDKTLGDAWVRHRTTYDATLEPFGTAIIQLIDPAPGERVLDIGCGAGTTTLTLAAMVDPGEVVGIDLSTPMIGDARSDAARQAVSNVHFVVDDVCTAELAGGPFDVAFSRLGIMFFPDPVAAFSNIARMLRDGGRLGFVCFKSPAENPFITVPLMAAAEHLDLGPPPDLHAPGPFSLAEPDRIRDILTAAGFAEVEIMNGPDSATLTAVPDLTVLATQVLEQTPMTHSPLAAADPDSRVAAISAVVEALGHHLDGDRVQLGAASWLVTARYRANS